MGQEVTSNTYSSMGKKCFNNYDELKKYIDGLPQPKPGYTRVFRGQWKDFGNLRPTGIRSPLRNEQVWRHYCKMLAHAELMIQGADFDHAKSMSNEWGYWYYAIVQHYGPGTHLLDVTRSLEIALWFALHKATENNNRIDFAIFGMPGPLGQGPARHRKEAWLQYREWKETPGILYILDVPSWNGSGVPSHGMLVDLANAPQTFHESARIKAQAGCLVKADKDWNNGGDLFDLIIDSVEVGWPMTGCDTVNLGTEVLFPPPQKDKWFSHLLFLPPVVQVYKEAPYWRIAHPVELSFYMELFTQLVPIVQFNALQPPLLFPWLIEYALHPNPTNIETFEKAAKYLDATPILLEAPALQLLEEKDYTIDHLELVYKLPHITGCLEWETDDISYSGVNLTKILIELSPLEVVGWSILLNRGGELQVPRAIYLVQKDVGHWELQVFFQLAPKEMIQVLFEEPASIRFEELSGRLQIQDKEEWKDISTNQIAESCLITSLMLLNALTPTHDVEKSFMDNYKTAPAVLKETPDIGAEICYYVVRDPNTNDIYTIKKLQV